MRARHPGLFVFLTACLAGSIPGQDEAGFLKGLADTRALMARGQWRAAQSSLDRLLQSHRGKEWALRKRTELLEDYKRCQFAQQHREPDPGSLIHGELVFHNRTAGTLKLRYGKDALGDFADGKDGVQLHPLELDGAYTITISGRKHPADRGPRLLVCVTGQSAIEVALGAPGEDVVVRQHDGQGATELARPAVTPAKAGAPFEVRVHVGEAALHVFFAGRMLANVRKPRGLFGRFGFVKADFDDLVIEGRTKAAWLQSELDAHMQEKLARFEESFDPRSVIPAWLLEGASPPAGGAAGQRPAAETAAAAAARKIYPGEIEEHHVPALNEAARLVNAHQFAEAQRHLEGLAPEQAPPAACAYLLAICGSAQDRPEEALRHCEAACRADPDFADGRNLRARILTQLHRLDDAKAELAAVIADFPRDGLAYQALALLLLRQGQPAQAKRVLEDAHARDARGAELDKLDRLLTMALRGPEWQRTFDYKSTSYWVMSDIDQRTCIDAARVLEQALVSYRSQLPGAPVPGERFHVFIFSGEAGYHAYCKQILGTVRQHTKGLYSQTLKQLLVWNLPDYQEMLRTVRHEGFHQYLDSISDDAPPWFNEGLALYYEGERTNGKLETGVVQPDLLRILARIEPRPLAEFLFLGDDAFYAAPEAHYAQAWAVVHFLRESTRENQKLFLDVFKAIRDSGQEGLKGALRGVPLPLLDGELRAHVARLLAEGKRASAPSAPR